MRITKSELYDILKHLVYDIYIDGDCIEIEYYANGKDCNFNFTARTFEELANEIKEVYNNYDIEEELEIYLPMRGKQGVPNSVFNIIKDLEKERDTLKEIYETINDYIER